MDSRFQRRCVSCYSLLAARTGIILSCGDFLCNSCELLEGRLCPGCQHLNCSKGPVRIQPLDADEIPTEISAYVQDAAVSIKYFSKSVDFQMKNLNRIISLLLLELEEIKDSKKRRRVYDDVSSSYPQQMKSQRPSIAVTPSHINSLGDQPRSQFTQPLALLPPRGSPIDGQRFSPAVASSLGVSDSHSTLNIARELSTNTRELLARPSTSASYPAQQQQPSLTALLPVGARGGLSRPGSSGKMPTGGMQRPMSGGGFGGPRRIDSYSSSSRGGGNAASSSSSQQFHSSSSLLHLSAGRPFLQDADPYRLSSLSHGQGRQDVNEIQGRLRSPHLAPIRSQVVTQNQMQQQMNTTGYQHRQAPPGGADGMSQNWRS